MPTRPPAEMSPGADLSARQQPRNVGDPSPFAAALSRPSADASGEQLETESSVALWSLVLRGATGGEAHVPPALLLEWFEPLIDGAAVWTSAAGRNKGLPP